MTLAKSDIQFGVGEWSVKVGGWVLTVARTYNLCYLSSFDISLLPSRVFPVGGSSSNNNVWSWWSIENSLSVLQRKQWPELSSSGGGDCG